MESGLAARNGGRVGLAALAAILLLGLGLRLGEAWGGRPPVYDAAAYARIAANLEEGSGFTVGGAATQPSSNYSPGLPLFVAGVYEVTGGAHERAARVALALIGTMSVLFTYLLGRRLWDAVAEPRPADRRPGLGVVGDRLGVVAGLVGALAVAVYPALLEYQGMLMSEPLAATLLSGAVLAILWAAEWRVCPPIGDKRATPARWVLPGVLLGTLALTRPEYLSVAFFLAVVVFILGGRGNWRRTLRQAAVLLVGLVVVVAPWTIRNAVALDRFVPISTGGGQVLFAGTYLPSDGDPEEVGEKVVAENPSLFQPRDARRLRLEQILAVLAADRYPELETDQALARMGREQLEDDVTEEPLEYAGFLATKVWRIWSRGPRAVMEEPPWKALQWLLVGLGAVGLAVLAWRRRWEALLLGTVFLSITVISALLVASPRRVLVLVPLVAALAGTGATWVGTEIVVWWRSRH